MTISDHRLRLLGRRLAVRPLEAEDFDDWRDVRLRNADWLLPWEPMRSPGQPDVVNDRDSFIARCRMRDRERQSGVGYGFGIEVENQIVGEINFNNVVRGAFQNAHVGYWIDRDQAGRGLVPEALVVLLRYGFEDLGLHRVQVAIIPRNDRSRRVVEKLGLRDEGLAEGYLEIGGVWELGTWVLPE
jgi:ribosomal-protein-alanine N-acetyltransferase